MFEHKTQPLLPFHLFFRRQLVHVVIGLAIMFASLALGILGYHYLEAIPWLDALLNASMILGGMGPVTTLHTSAGKVFASGYALFSGAIFLVVMSIIIAPAAHRLLHKLHLEAGK